MRIVVVGAGGVGSLVGGLLARAGNDVGFLARGRQLAALRAGGLEVESPRGTFHLPKVDAAGDPASLAPADAVLVGVKSWQVREVAPAVARLLAPEGFALPLENGVEAAEELAATVGAGRVVGGLCHMLAWLERPGLVRHMGEHLRVTMGELGVREDIIASGQASEKQAPRGAADRSAGPGGSARVEALAAVLRAAHIDATVAPDMGAALWEKFLFIAAFGGVGAATRSPIGEVRAIPESRALLQEVMEEIAAVARARGVRLPADATARALRTLDGLPATATASMQRDLQAGKPSELREQTGAIVRMGREAAVPTPANGVLLAALLPQELRASAAAQPT